MNRLTHAIQESKNNKSKLFCAFLTLGYPNLKTTEKLILEFERVGVDIVELGIPFSDPLADGPTIQKASDDCLRRGVSLTDGLKLVAKLRKNGCKVPIICFCYMNPIHRMGVETFPKLAQQAGFDGVLIPDLIPDEEIGFQKFCSEEKLSCVFLITPTTDLKRARMIGRKSKDFIYYVSLRGVTGARAQLGNQIKSEIDPYQKMIDKPFLIGFGIGNPDQAKKMAGLSSGVIVGSAIVEKIRTSKGRIGPVVDFVSSMVRATKCKSL